MITKSLFNSSMKKCFLVEIIALSLSVLFVSLGTYINLPPDERKEY